ncbi:hypothetical protein [Clostridium tagluense]|uniref:Uncharacterized protein n=1 Tax=Clostridium tagluense TaxID=360422 RepID=A0A401UPG7_9CLOT|nr:hypothetical protein [Clostridium tagluense]GCD11401.1 hypothetical protein Ctaglu_30240 [Clostridium tagluense]
MDKQQIHIDLTFEQFKERCLEIVRSDNYMDLVKSWEENIVYTSFTKNLDKSYWKSDIYYVSEYKIDKYYIKHYEFSYITDYNTFFVEDYQYIDRKVIKALAKLESLVAKSKDMYMSDTLSNLQLGGKI